MKQELELELKLPMGMLFAGIQALRHLCLERFGERNEALPSIMDQRMQEEMISLIKKRIDQDQEIGKLATEISRKCKIDISEIPEGILCTMQYGIWPYESLDEEEAKLLNKKFGRRSDLLHEAWHNLFRSGRIGPEGIAIPVRIEDDGERTEAYPCGIDYANAVWIPHSSTLKGLDPKLSHSDRFFACQKIAKEDLLEYGKLAK